MEEVINDSWLNRKIAPNISNKILADTLYPTKISSYSLPGKSHFYNNNSVVINEDISGTFVFNCGTEYIEKTENIKNYNDVVTGIFIADGHGENRNVPPNKDKWFGSGGENFVLLLKNNIENVLKAIFRMANYGVKRDFEMEKMYKYYSKVSEEEEKAKPERYFLKHLREGLKNFNRMMDQTLSDEDPTLCNDNGSTICICLTWRKYLFCLNIGDSNMMIFDPCTGTPLRVWKRHMKDDMYNVCSYDDTLASYPDYLHEGQTLYAVKQDYNFIGEYCKSFASFKGKCFYSLTSPSSIYGLSLINTLGNRNHIGRTLSRTSVYEFQIPELLEKTKNNQFTIVCVTDGIKDVLNSTNIGRLFTNMQEGIKEIANEIKLANENEEKAKQIYYQYETAFASERENNNVMSSKYKLYNRLSPANNINNKEDDIFTEEEDDDDDDDENGIEDENENDENSSEEINIKKLIKNLKQIVYGYNKNKAMDIFDKLSLRTIKNTIKNKKINSYILSDYYLEIKEKMKNEKYSSDSILNDNENDITTTTQDDYLLDEYSQKVKRNKSNESQISTNNTSSSLNSNSQSENQMNITNSTSTITSTSGSSELSTSISANLQKFSPKSTTNSLQEQNKQIQHRNINWETKSSYYPEYLKCLTNIASLCQTLDDCTSIIMEIKDCS